MLNPRAVRWVLACLATASMLALVYASIVPLDFRHISWSTAVDRFRNIPWLNLSVGRRADWVANALVVIPSGFLALGAIDWKRPSRVPTLIMLPIVAIGLSALVVGIEFLQLWFPGRTVSQNDILAGTIGAWVGVTAWMILGRATGHWIERFMSLPPGEPRFVWLIGAYTFGLFLYTLFPFDPMLSVDEWREKYAAGRLTLIPLSDLEWSVSSMISMAIAMIQMIPIGLAIRIVIRSRMSYWWVILVSCMLELAQMPIFTRFASTSDVVFGIAGGTLGIYLHSLFSHVKAFAQRGWLWLVAIGCWSGFSALLILGRYERWATGDEARQRLEGFWVPPLVRYYFESEFEAGANLLGKCSVFAVLGFLLAGGVTLSSHPQARRIWTGLAMLWTIALGIAIELSQAWLIPFVPDVNDLVIYLFGSMSGAILYRLLLNKDDISAIGHQSYRSVD